MSRRKPRQVAGSKRLLLLPVAALVMATFSGCAVTPQALTDEQRQTRVHNDIETLFKDVEPITGPLTLHEAEARALKYNYDARLKLMEEALANAQLDLNHYDMLPNLALSAGYSVRNNDAGSSSVNLSTGAVSNLYSGAQDRQTLTTTATLSWNILDFGVSYVRAQQQASQVLIANERKRKVVQNIMQDVRQAYWRAYGAEKTLPKLNVLLDKVGKALDKSRVIEEQHLMTPIDALTYQRSLIDLYQQIVSRRQELVVAKTELAALIDIRPGSEFKLDEKEALKTPTDLQLINDIDALDQAALNNRPELREEDYRKQITVLDARKALYSMLPGISVNTSFNRDSNSYLYQNQWVSSGATISFNLLRAFSYPSARQAQKAQAVVDDTRRIALAMAVLTQVRIAGQRYHEAMEDYDITLKSSGVDERIQQYMQAGLKANTESDMNLLRSEVKTAMSEMQRYSSFANLQMAYARVANSLGADMLPEKPNMDNLGQFAQQLETAEDEWRNTVFVRPSARQEKAQIPVAKPVAPAPAPVAKPAEPAPAPVTKPVEPVPPIPPAKAEEQQPVPATVTVKAGDTMSNIAEVHKPSGTSTNRMTIALYRANRERLPGHDINRLKPGIVLRMPTSEELGKISDQEADSLMLKLGDKWRAGRSSGGQE